jgi:hypothetical protein
VLVASAGCGAPSGPQVRVIDLLESAGAAEKRPAAAKFHVEEHTFGGERRASLVTPPDSRVIWELPLPAHATLNTAVALTGSAETDAATFRIAVSDHRVYEALTVRTATAGERVRGWIPMAANLSRYAGRQLSLFYRPDGRQWRVILTVSRAGGTPENAFWATPGIDADTTSAKRFLSRRTR